jgi:hypothetical protein
MPFHNSFRFAIEPIDFGLEALTAVKFTDINGNPPYFSNAILQGAESVECISQVVGPFPSVPESSSTLSLLALGTLGAASILKRKLKPTKSTKKETTKVS